MKCNGRWTVPDYSGKYHGKLNDKKWRENKHKCNCKKKDFTENYQNQEGKHKGKNND